MRRITLLIALAVVAACGGKKGKPFANAEDLTMAHNTVDQLHQAMRDLARELPSQSSAVEVPDLMEVRIFGAESLFALGADALHDVLELDIRAQILAGEIRRHANAVALDFATVERPKSAPRFGLLLGDESDASAQVVEIGAVLCANTGPPGPKGCLDGPYSRLHTRTDPYGGAWTEVEAERVVVPAGNQVWDELIARAPRAPLAATYNTAVAESQRAEAAALADLAEALSTVLRAAAADPPAEPRLPTSDPRKAAAPTWRAIAAAIERANEQLDGLANALLESKGRLDGHFPPFDRTLDGALEALDLVLPRAAALETQELYYLPPDVIEAVGDHYASVVYIRQLVTAHLAATDRDRAAAAVELPADSIVVDISAERKLTLAPSEVLAVLLRGTTGDAAIRAYTDRLTKIAVLTERTLELGRDLTKTLVRLADDHAG